MDDIQPFNPRSRVQVEEVSLSDELKKIEAYNKEYQKGTQMIRSELETLNFPVYSRVKGTYSTINKLRRKHLERDELKDIGGCMVVTDTIPEAYAVGEHVKERFRVVDMDDYYANPTRMDYRALHYTVIVNGRLHEIQVKTRKDYAKALEMHTRYKVVA